MLHEQPVHGMFRYLHGLVQMHSMAGAIVEVFEELGEVLSGSISNLFALVWRRVNKVGGSVGK